MSRNKQSCFTALPIELRQYILQNSADLVSLRNCVTSCQAYRHAYVNAREVILSNVTRRQYGPWLDDVLLLLRARQVINPSSDLSRSKARTAIFELLASFKRSEHFVLLRQADTQGLPFAPWIIAYQDLTDTLQVIQSMLQVIQRMCSRFGRILLNHVLNTTSGHYYNVCNDLSDTELARFGRALSRYETYCVLFSHSQRKPSEYGSVPEPIKSDWYSAEEIAELYFAMFLPWELEEMACVFDFYKTEYASIFAEIVQRVSREKPPPGFSPGKWDPAPYWFDMFDIRPYTEGHESGSEYLAELGMPFYEYIYRVQKTRVRDHAIEQYLAYVDRSVSFHRILQECIDEHMQDQDFYPAEGMRSCFLHAGTDSSATSASASASASAQQRRPSAGWVWIRHALGDPELGLTTPRIDAEVPLFSQVRDRQWGYVFWDERRLHRWGVTADPARSKWKPQARDYWMVY